MARWQREGVITCSSRYLLPPRELPLPPTPSVLQYETAIVTFMDILGFRDLIQRKSADEVSQAIDLFRENSPQHVDSTLGELEAAGLLDGPHEAVPGDARVIAFSDSIIRVQPAGMESGLFYELLGVLHAQGELVMRGILIRGGVALGEVFVSDDRIFGPAFVEAYEIESKVSIYPRIVVSPRALHGLRDGSVPPGNHHGREWEMSYVKGLLMRGDDGLWSIDYLRGFRAELDVPEMYGEYLAKHLEIIQMLAKAPGVAHGDITSLALKANWLAMYHNQVVNELSPEELSAFGFAREDLLVADSELPTLFEFPPGLPSEG